MPVAEALCLPFNDLVQPPSPCSSLSADRPVFVHVYVVCSCVCIMVCIMDELLLAHTLSLSVLHNLNPACSRHAVAGREHLWLGEGRC